MNKTMLKMAKWQEVLAKQNLSEKVRQLLYEVYMHIRNQEYEMKGTSKDLVKEI